MTRITKRGLALVCGILLTACAQEETGEGEEMTAEDTTAAAELAGISLADVAGTWTVNAMTEAGEAVPQFEFMATADPSGWEFRFPDRPPVPVRVVQVAGDSIVTEAGPYESLLRPGVQVTTSAVWRFQGDRLVSTTVAHYQTTDPDSVITVRSEATRMP